MTSLAPRERRPQPVRATPTRSRVLQRKCACGGTPGPDGECAACRRRRLAPKRVLQPKLRVGPVGDRFEREADRMADLFVRGEGLGPSVTPLGVGRVQRAEAETPTESLGPIKDVGSVMETIESQGGEPDAPASSSGDDALVQPWRMGAGGTRAGIKSLPRSSGAPLQPEARAAYEGFFGRDFGSVRVHSGGASDRFVRGIGARAAAAGSDIYLADGALSGGGDWLMAHELTHVVQQGHASPLGAPAGPGDARAGPGVQRSAGGPVRERTALRVQRYQSRICRRESNAHASRQPRDFPRTYISQVNVNLGTQRITLDWTGPSASSQTTGPFNCSTGAGVRGQTSCNNTRHSRRSNTCCTPKGTWTITGQQCKTSRLRLQNFSAFQRAGIGLHYYGSVPRVPASHGCVRLGRAASEHVFDSARSGRTRVAVTGNATGHRRYRSCS